MCGSNGTTVFYAPIGYLCSPSPGKTKAKAASKSPAKKAAKSPAPAAKTPKAVKPKAASPAAAPKAAAAAAAPTTTTAAHANNGALFALLITSVVAYLGAHYLRKDLHFLSSNAYIILKTAPIGLLGWLLHDEKAG